MVQSLSLFNADDPKSYPSPPVEIIKGILYIPVITTIWGRPESGKSHIAIDMACTLAQQHKVIYVCAEAPHEILLRVNAWKSFYEKTCNNNLFIWKDPLPLMERERVQTFIATINPIKPTIIFIDPLAQCMDGGNENETKDMVIVTNNLNLIARTLNTAICLVAHTGWRDDHERGSSVLRAFNRVSFSTSKTSEGHIRFHHEKMNSGKRIEDKYFDIKQVGDIETQTILLPTVEITSTTELTERQKQVLLALAMPAFASGVTRTELIKYLDESHKIPSKTTYKVINILIDKQLAMNKSSNIIAIDQDGIAMAATLKDEENLGIKKEAILLNGHNWILSNSPQFSQDSPAFSSDSPTSTTSNSPILLSSPFLEGEQENKNEKELENGEKSIGQVKKLVN
jgi:hypothetical protein